MSKHANEIFKTLYKIAYYNNDQIHMTYHDKNEYIIIKN